MSGVFLGGDFLAVYDALSRLLGLDLSAYNDDAVFLVCSVFLLIVVCFLYDFLLMLFGYIGGKRK
mgnify:CR=1 FL=1